MARVNKCDRCGIIYEDYIVTRKINSKNARNYNGFVFSKDGFVYPNEFAIDLCPECLDELIEWLNRKEK